MKRLVLKITFLLLSGFFTSLNAQETTADIQGIITEKNATPMIGATIIAIHQPTGTKYTTTTRKDGRYNLANLRVGGPYEITASYVGFKEEKQTDIFLLIGQTFKADFILLNNSTELKEVVVTATRSDKVFNKSRTGSAEVGALPVVSAGWPDYP